MDQDLELTIIEKGYNPLNQTRQTLAGAAHILREMYESSTPPAGMLLFDGSTSLRTTNSVMGQQLEYTLLGVLSSAPSVDFYNLTDSSGNLLHLRKKENHIIIVDNLSPWELSVGVRFAGADYDHLKLHLATNRKTDISYLLPTSAEEQNVLFWAHISTRLRISLSQDRSGPAYKFKDGAKRPILRLETAADEYLITAEFPQKKDVAYFQKLMNGTRVRALTVDDKMVGGTLVSGRKLRAGIYRGEGKEVVKYLSAILQS